MPSPQETVERADAIGREHESYEVLLKPLGTDVSEVSDAGLSRLPVLITNSADLTIIARFLVMWVDGFVMGAMYGKADDDDH